MRGLYFIEHGLTKAQADHLRQALQESLAPTGLQYYVANDGASPSNSLLDACQRTYLSSIGIYDLSAPKPDTYLQIGISVGLNKPALIIAGQGITSAIPSVLDRANTWLYTPPIGSNRDLQRAVLRSLDNKEAPEKEEDEPQIYCTFCQSLCKGWRKPARGKGFLLLDSAHPQWKDLGNTIRDALKPTGLTPICLSQLKGQVMPLLCEMRLAVLASEFTLLDLSARCDPEQYIALGMAISMRRPWLLATSQPEALPPLLQHVSRLEYAGDQDLHEHLAQYVLKTRYPAKFAATQGATAASPSPELGR